MDFGWLSNIGDTVGGWGSGALNLAGQYPGGVLAGGASLAGLISQIYNQNQQRQAMDKYLSAAKKQQAQMTSLSGQPIDPSAYYQPATAEEFNQMKRMVDSDLASRGIQPGGAWVNSELVASQQDTAQRMRDAYAVATNQRQQQLGAMGGAFSGTLGAYGAKAGSPGITIGDPSAFGKYMQYIQESRARQAAQSQQQSRSAGLNYNPSPGQVDTGFSSSSTISSPYESGTMQGY